MDEDGKAHAKKVLAEYDAWAEDAARSLDETKKSRIHHYMSCSSYDDGPCTCWAVD